MTTEQLKIWQSQFGEEYTERAKIDVNARTRTFRETLRGIDIHGVLEVGCGKGDNLAALTNLGYRAIGVDPLQFAVDKAREAGLIVFKSDCFRLQFLDSSFGLVLSCGMLMHVASDDLNRAVKELWRVSSQYLLVAEYYAAEETVIPYRGHDNFLFKRDYGFIGEIVRGGIWGKSDGFDDLHWWLFNKK